MISKYIFDGFTLNSSFLSVAIRKAVIHRDRPICFFAADTDVSAIHGPIADICKIFDLIFCLLSKILYNVFYALPFFEKLQKLRFMS